MATFNYPLFPFLMPTGMMGPPLNPGSNAGSFTGEPAQHALPRNIIKGGSFDVGDYGANLSGHNLDIRPYTLTELGFYELDVQYMGGDPGSITRFPLAVVDPKTLVVQLQEVTHTGGGPAFKQFLDRLPNTYAHGRAAPAFRTPEYVVNVYVNQAVVLDIRATVDGQLAILGYIICKGPGLWRSAPLTLPRGLSQIKTAVVFEESPFIIGVYSPSSYEPPEEAPPPPPPTPPERQYPPTLAIWNSTFPTVNDPTNIWTMQQLELPMLENLEGRDFTNQVGSVLYGQLSEPTGRYSFVIQSGYIRTGTNTDYNMGGVGSGKRMTLWFRFKIPQLESLNQTLYANMNSAIGHRLTVLPDGSLRFDCQDGADEAYAYVPGNHCDNQWHDVMVVCDRADEISYAISDLGQSSIVSLTAANIGSMQNLNYLRIGGATVSTPNNLEIAYVAGWYGTAADRAVPMSQFPDLLVES